MEYPRAWEARITYTDSGETEVIQTGEHADALVTYELADMEKAIRGDAECMHLDYTKDVMDMMTEFRRMGISVSGGDVNYGTKTHLFFR